MHAKSFRTITLLQLVIILSCWSVDIIAQNLDLISKGGEIIDGSNNKLNPCISEQLYKQIEMQCFENIKKIGLDFNNKSAIKTTLSWPLKPKTGLDDCSYYIVSAHVDHNATSGTFTDYTCGTKTYDGHRGTDIAIFPFPFYKLDHDEVEVIAAAPGTIIDKVDGNFDKNCGSNNLQANYLVIQHADGSRVLYFHMKKNSLTAKTIGQSVVEGEYLGVVGSSGNSSGPHLHFEVWSGSTVSTYIDPYAGTCNLLNNTSWWVDQKPYTETAVVKASVNTTDVVVPACPATETTNETECFSIPFQGAGLPAGFAKFYVFLRNETQGLTANLNILNPDGSVFTSWTYTSTTSYKQSYRSWSKSLPSVPGTYTFNASYNGTSCSKKFNIVKALITANAPATICEGSSLQLSANEAKIYLWSTGDTSQIITVSKAGDYKVTITNIKGCTSVSEPFKVNVNPLPIVKITPNGPTTFCQGEMVELASETANAYAWSNGLTSKKIVVSNAGVFKLTITDQNGCNASDSIIVNMNIPQNGLKIIEKKDSLFSPYGEPSYWFLDGTPTAIDTGKIIMCSQSGIYFVTGPDINNCLAISDTIDIKCNSTFTINSEITDKLWVYPNPANKNLYFKHADIGEYILMVTDLFGRVILSNKISIEHAENENSITLKGLPDGVYFLQLRTSSKILVSKFIKTS